MEFVLDFFATSIILIEPIEIRLGVSLSADEESRLSAAGATAADIEKMLVKTSNAEQVNGWPAGE